MSDPVSEARVEQARQLLSEAIAEVTLRVPGVTAAEIRAAIAPRRVSVRDGDREEVLLAGMSVAELAAALPTMGSNLRLAGLAMTAMHDVARRALETRARLRAWCVARLRGIAATPAAGGFLWATDCDAIAEASVDAVFEMLAAWAAEDDDEDGDG